MKADFDAKVEAIREAHRAQIAEETRHIHSKLATDLQEAQTQAAFEYTKLVRQMRQTSGRWKRLST